jgi:hypothetical protein
MPMEYAEPPDVSRLGRVNHGISNLIVLLLVMRWQFDMVDHIFGVHGAALLNALVIAWMSQAAQRVLEARRGSYMYCSPRNARSWAVVVAGTAPWPIAEKLYETHPGWPLWQSMALPPAVRGAGWCWRWALFSRARSGGASRNDSARPVPFQS